MNKTKFTKAATHALVILMTISFVISAVLPDYNTLRQKANMEEADMDGQSSSEEKKENKEHKESLQYDIYQADNLAFVFKNLGNTMRFIPLFQQRYLPVITPPPDHMTIAS
ncbi:hypothetical protein N7E81_09075 [Reichenbachiella carrageenanivorans]|uniref:Uncharacterized protein n=1 Tax=Reichenbachiella carrageenanivorans TaxID=2979869 RepID=A0ABY6D529_9BACT|nr:hypothetical protein [Reichenbachiella carrageenanivorans]UXX81247.1 hypothetical protein N7E81_09075 [Reichenbachiella carrageenanivorans]